MIIYKYAIQFKEHQQTLMPRGAKVLSVQTQNGKPFIWAACEREAAQDFRHFRVLGTGREVANDEWARLTYVGTWQDGPFVWHLFEENRHE